MGSKAKFSVEDLEDLASDLRDWITLQNKFENLALLSSWCINQGMYPTSLTYYCSRSEKFADAVADAKAYQEHIIAKKALENKVNVRFAIFFLSCVHKWKHANGLEDKIQALENSFDKFAKTMDKLYEEKNPALECSEGNQ